MSTAKSKNPPAKGGLSLYANLLDPTSSSNNAGSSTISRAPVVFQQPDDSSTTSAQDEAAAAAKKQINAAALRFQPARRPQVAAQKAKTKAAGFARAIPAAITGGGGKAAAGNASSSEATIGNTNGSAGPNAIHQPQPPAAKATLADWTATNNEDDDNVNGFYQGEKRQRGGRKKRKKGNKGGEAMQVVQDWDDIYDPTRPNNYDEYFNSDEKRREIREWKEKLYAHRRARRRDSISSSSDREDRERPMKAFAPPTNYSFAPPPIKDTTDNASTTEPEPAAVAADMAEDATGEDAYLRRLRLSNAASEQPAPDEAREAPMLSPLPPSQAMPPLAPAIASPLQRPSSPLQTSQSPPPPPPSSDTLTQPSFSGLPPTAPTPASATATISRAPVRYNLPAAPAEIEVSQDDLDASLARDITNDNASTSNTAATTDTTENQAEQQIQASAPAPRSNRPGQAGFAERYMASQGWKRGEGLGASGSGIINPLRVQVEKRKQRSDADGGGFVGPGGKGKIVGGGKRKKTASTTTTEGGAEAETEQHGKFGPMSEVVVARGMLVGMDVDVEIANGLLQELGEECEAKYGRLVRVFINRESTEDSPPVFFHFTTALSALRAVNALHGRVFNGNTITARFFDAEKFEKDSFE